MQCETCKHFWPGYSGDQEDMAEEDGCAVAADNIPSIDLDQQASYEKLVNIYMDLAFYNACPHYEAEVA